MANNENQNLVERDIAEQLRQSQIRQSTQQNQNADYDQVNNILQKVTDGVTNIGNRLSDSPQVYRVSPQPDSINQAVYNAVQNSPDANTASGTMDFNQNYIKDGQVTNDNSNIVAGHGQQIAATIDNGNLEQTDYGQGVKKVNDATAMMMAIAANHEAHQINRIYSSIDFKEMGITDLYSQSSARMDQYLSIAQIDGQSGFMWQTEAKLNDLKYGIGNTSVGQVNAQVKCPDGTTMSLSQLKESNPDSLGFDLSDCKMIRYDGVVTNLSINDFEKMNLASLAKQVQEDNDALMRIGSANNIYEKRAALEEIRGKQLEALSGSNPTIRHTIDMYKNDPVKMNIELDKLKKSGKLSNAEIKNIDNYLKSGGELSDLGSDLTAAGQKSKKLIGDKMTNLVLGNSEFGMGVRTIQRTTTALHKTIEAAEKFGYKANIKIATKKLNKAQRKVEKVGKEGIKGQKAANKLNKAQEKVDKRIEQFNKYKKDKDVTARKTEATKKRLQKRQDRFDRNTKRIDARTKRLEEKYAKLKKSNLDTKGTKKKLDQVKQHQIQRLKKAQEAAKKAAARKAKKQALEKTLSNIASKIMETVAGVKKYLYIIIAAIFALFLVIELTGAQLAAIGGVIGAIMSFNPIDELRGAVTPTDFQAELNDINYNQYIVDKVSTELSQSFITVAKKDAQNHFLLRSRIPNMEGYYWYMDVIDGEIGNVWMREQEDNVSTLDGNGFVSGYTTRGWVNVSGTGAAGYATNAAYNNALHPAYKVSNAAYVREPNARKRLKSVNSNVLPIVAMANYRFTDGIDYNSFCDVMAYVYYMYVQSHDIARYDSNNEEETYYAEVSTKCKIYNAATGQWVDKIYEGDNARVWQTGNASNRGMVLVPTTSATCSNIYVHGYDRIWGKELMAARAEAQEIAANVENWLRNVRSELFFGVFDNDTQRESLPVGTELVFRNPNGSLTFSGNTANKTWQVEYYGDTTSTAGMGNLVLDDDDESLLNSHSDLYRYYQTESVFVDNGHITCNNLAYYEWSTNERALARGTVVSNPADQTGGSLNAGANDWYGVTCGMQAHLHNSYDGGAGGCIRLTCINEAHVHGDGNCSWGNCPVGYAHTHGDGYCTYRHSDSCYTSITRYYKTTVRQTRLPAFMGGGWVDSSTTTEEVSSMGSNSTVTSPTGSSRTIITYYSETSRGGLRNISHNGCCTRSEHTHTNTCCSKEEHVHRSLATNTQILSEIRAASGGNLPANGTFTFSGTSRTEDSISYWTFYNADNNTLLSGGNAIGAITTCTYEISGCNLPEHTHNPIIWYKDSNGDNDHRYFPADPGCHQIVAVCQGHCGGHLKPIINIVVTDTFEGLMVIDNFKMTSCVSWLDFNSVATSASTLLMPTVGSWKLYWNMKAATWFSPFPSSPAAGIAYVSQRAIYWSAGITDSITSWISTQDDGDGDIPYEVDDTVKSVDAFDGWWEDEYHVDTEKLDYLKEFYGDWNDESGEYNYGVDMFASPAFRVEFPMGINKCVDYAAEINILRQLEEQGVNERQMAMATDAIHKAGAFYYSDSLFARQNAAIQSSGASDLSGFVLGIFNNVNTMRYTMIPFESQGEYASGFTVGLCSSRYSEAYNGGAVQTGDVLLSESNHMACVVIGNIYDERTNTTQLQCVVISELAGGTKLATLNKSRFDRIIRYDKYMF